MAREEIERRIDKAVDGAKAEAARGLAEVNGQVRTLYQFSWGLASAALLAFVRRHRAVEGRADGAVSWGSSVHRHGLLRALILNLTATEALRRYGYHE